MITGDGYDNIHHPKMQMDPARRRQQSEVRKERACSFPEQLARVSCSRAECFEKPSFHLF